MKIINFWEAPRCRATVISYAIYNGLRASGHNCVYQDEPWHWRNTSKPEFNPNDSENPDYVINKDQAMWLFDRRSRFRFSKIYEIIEGYNVFVIRDSEQSIMSHIRNFLKLYPDRKESDIDTAVIGFAQLEMLFMLSIAQNPGRTVLLNSDKLIMDPAVKLMNLCKILEIEYNGGMMSWDTVDIEKPPWGEHWYEKLFESKGFTDSLNNYTYAPDIQDERIVFARNITERMERVALSGTGAIHII